MHGLFCLLYLFYLFYFFICSSSIPKLLGLVLITCIKLHNLNHWSDRVARSWLALRLCMGPRARSWCTVIFHLIAVFASCLVSIMHLLGQKWHRLAHPYIVQMSHAAEMFPTLVLRIASTLPTVHLFLVIYMHSQRRYLVRLAEEFLVNFFGCTNKLGYFHMKS